MPDYLAFDPDSYRTVADQHGSHAADLRIWGQVPQDWLDDFPNQYGTIAHQVHGALTTYYTNRQAEVEQVAIGHERARDVMLMAAQAVPNADQGHGQQITRAASYGGNAAPSGPAPGAAPVAPTGPGPATSISNGTQLGPLPGSDTSGPSGQTPLGGSVPPVDGSRPAGDTASVGASPLGPAPVAYVPIEPASVAAATAGVVPVTGGSVGAAASPVAMGETGDAKTIAAAIIAKFLADIRTMPPPLMAGPFAAAVHVAKIRKTTNTPPPFVVGDTIDDDFVLARTLLAAILAATADSAPELEWAVAVLRTPGGPLVQLTSNEGRGWLPPGLFLPSEVVIPWRWDAMLGPAARETVAKMEGAADPARMLADVLAEFISSRGVGARITALVSSTAIPSDLRATLDEDVALQGRVMPAESVVDFTSPGEGLVDRLTLGGSPQLQQQAATVPDKDIRATCLELAQAGDTRVRTAIRATDAGMSARRARRQQALDMLSAGERIPASWWEPTGTAEGRISATPRSRRVDIAHVSVGIRTDSLDTETRRAVALDRRVDELLMLAANEPGRQTLRDALYAYGQITEHPLLRVAMPAAVVGAAVGSGNLTEVPPPVAELMTGLAGSDRSGEQRRA